VVFSIVDCFVVLHTSRVVLMIRLSST